MAKVVVDEAGNQFTVVEEGDPDDILLAKPAESSAMEPQAVVPAEQNPTPEPAAPARRSRQAEPAVKVQVIMPQARVPVVEEPELTDEEADELEKQLDELIAAEVAKQVKEATASVQSAKDREIAASNARMQAVEAELKTLREKELEAQLASLDPEERAAYLDKRALEEEKARLLTLANEIDEVYKGQLITALVQEYGDYGITAEDISDIDDPDDMEAYCERAKTIYEKVVARTGARIEPAASAAPAPATRQTTVPAGATAPTDIGGGSPDLGPNRKPVEGTGLEFAAQTLESLPWETVRV